MSGIFRVTSHILALTLLVVLPAVIQAQVKVNKNLITVSPPNAAGVVDVKGSPGSVTFSSPPTSVFVENMATQTRVPVSLQNDASFTVRVNAQSGQQIRVKARIAGDKESYGTFTIPQATAATAKTDTPATYFMPALNLAAAHAAGQDPNNPGLPDQSGQTGQPGQADLLFILMAVDPQTGQIVAIRSVKAHSGSESSDTEKRQLFINRIFDQCFKAIADEIKAGQSAPTPPAKP